MPELKRLFTSALIIAAVVVLGFVLSVPRAREVSEPAPPAAVSPVPSITLRDSFKNGTHTITGSLIAPDVCTLPTATAAVENAPARPAILLAVLLPDDPQVCLAIPTTRSFTVSVEAPEGTPVTATINGLAATTTNS